MHEGLDDSENVGDWSNVMFLMSVICHICQECEIYDGGGAVYVLMISAHVHYRAP